MLESKFESNFDEKTQNKGVLITEKINIQLFKMPTNAAKEQISKIDIVKIICYIQHKIVTNLKLSFHDQKHFLSFQNKWIQVAQEGKL